MLRERLRGMDLKITELADYLLISRPTMYKFIDCYEAGDYDKINGKVLKLFNYIVQNDLAGKKSVVGYILNNLADLKDMGNSEENAVLRAVKKCITSNPTSKKSKFFKIISQDAVFDEIIFYLADARELLAKKRLTEKNREFLKPYTEFVQKLKEIQTEQGD